MTAHEAPIVGRLMKFVVIGAVGGLVFAVLLMTLDVANIGTMLSTASAKALMLALVLGGSATKGAAFGFAYSVAVCGRQERLARPAFGPVLAAKAS